MAEGLPLDEFVSRDPLFARIFTHRYPEHREDPEEEVNQWHSGHFQKNILPSAVDKCTLWIENFFFRAHNGHFGE